MAANALLKNITSTEEWMKKLFKKLLKKLLPAIKHSSVQGKNFFSGTNTLDHSLFLIAATSVSNCSSMLFQYL